MEAIKLPGVKIKLSDSGKDYAELCRIHSQIMKLEKKEAALILSLKAACITSASVEKSVGV